jgi:hypothetical protein
MSTEEITVGARLEVSPGRRSGENGIAMQGPSPGRSGTGAARRPRGRPSAMSPETILEEIRRLAQDPLGIFRVHRTHSALYGRARRRFGSWSAAVSAAGLDYGAAMERARERSLQSRRMPRRQDPAC